MILFLLFWLLFCLFFFAVQELNLTSPLFSLSHSRLVWWLSLINQHRLVVMLIFLVLSFALIWQYFYLFKHKFYFPCWFWLLLIFMPLPIFPLFSYDIFNYLFNAKMVLIYHANPYLQVALNFPNDPMLRFMHNIHTPAPYAYGWTLISLIPGLGWFTGKFTLSFWLMKLFIIGFWLSQLWILNKLVKRLYPNQTWRFYLFALNPLVLIETLINGHNDVVMMSLALLSFWFYLNSAKIKALLFLIASASIKYVTILLLPFYWLKPKLDLPTIFSLTLFMIMFSRPDQLHSWYLIWAFSFAVLSRFRLIIFLFTALSFGALLRYAPFLYFGSWNSPVYLIRNLIWFISIFLTPFIIK
mgnify:CR=1 FL=1